VIGTDGLILLPGRLDRAAQRALVRDVRDIIALAPLFQPRMPRTGAPLSVQMTNCGPLGWVSDQAGGYRYQAAHPETGRPWPPMPPLLLALWREIGGYPHPPEACLINIYGATAKMGLHVDADEAAVNAPVVSISLGDTALFRLGGPKRGDPTRSFRLSSGDVMALTGPARGFFHGVDRIYPGTSTVLEEGGRINLTLRRVNLQRA
jgi:alkylated DNA repair protein (DNA oxidative demethylase)